MNWNNVIKDMSKGLPPTSAYYKEQEKVQAENRKQYEEKKAKKLKKTKP